MKPAHKHHREPVMEKPDTSRMSDLAAKSFETIAPFWPLKNLIAVNPLQGLEGMAIEEALVMGAAYFQQADLPEKMQAVNRETIKWLQAFFDDGQATIGMPLRQNGLYHAWRELAVYDVDLHSKDALKQSWLRNLPTNAEQAIAECMLRLSIPKHEREQFATLMLTTLPGWAGFVKYRTEWAGLDTHHPHPVNQSDYLALRLIVTCLLWPEAKTLLAWHAAALQSAEMETASLERIQETEHNYRLPLLEKLAVQPLKTPRTPQAQIVFCIDVRSEPFRRALEATGDYETLGFAGFFGISAQITDTVTGESHASCPVLLTPKHEVKESPIHMHHMQADRRGYERVTSFKLLYQSLKYTFSSPFALVETLGLASGIWMALRSLTPKLASQLKDTATQTLRAPQAIESSLENISFPDQCAYAEGALRMMGLTHHFAPLVVFCGHGSTTQNNAYATALDCGACGGRHGGSNARILAAIMNRDEIRGHLFKQGIVIPASTLFLAAEHNTTTDEVVVFDAAGHEAEGTTALLELKADMEEAREKNSSARLQRMQIAYGTAKQTWLRSRDWAQIRPEWGLARNAAFIIAPRDITKNIDLEGRCFLHSYDHSQDAEGSLLSAILTAPMVVAEWINTQYLFSTLDNVAYGGGSKITKNITGKIGIMQGNASDLMTGLPLQSVYSSDAQTYHEPQRLMTVVYAPRPMLDAIIQTQPILQKLFGNGWVQLACLEPETRETYFLNRALIWERA